MDLSKFQNLNIRLQWNFFQVTFLILEEKNKLSGTWLNSTNSALPIVPLAEAMVLMGDAIDAREQEGHTTDRVFAIA